MLKVLLIGAGKLGSRHLQALTKIRLPIDSIDVVDPSLRAIENAKSLLSASQPHLPLGRVNFYQSIENIGQGTYFLAIVATTADHRRAVVEQLLRVFKIQNMILEKFLFQRLDDFRHASQLFYSKGIPVWVNLPRREWPFYKNLRALLGHRKIISVDVIGSKWSIATSAIHFIDLISFLGGGIDYSVTEVDFEPEIVNAYSVVTGDRESKYKEFFGSISGHFSCSVGFKLLCERAPIPFSIVITLDSGAITIYEEHGYAVCSNALGEMFPKGRLRFDVPYQSELTNLIVEEIFDTGTCGLPLYEESARLHMPLASAYLKFINEVTASESKELPIT